jgi:hypothetical protein
VTRLSSNAPVPEWAEGGPFHSVTRSPSELSIVCLAAQVPVGVTCRKGWRCLAVAGPMPFELTGVLASLASPLATASVSVFALSTYDTDYLLVLEEQVEQAVAALRAAGHELVG